MKQQTNQDPYGNLAEQVIGQLYSEQGMKLVTEAFKSGMPIEESIPGIVSGLISQVLGSAIKAQKQVPPEAIILLMTEVTQAVLELAEAAGVINKEQFNEAGMQSFIKAAQQVDQNVGQNMRPGEREKYGAFFQQLMGGQQAPQEAPQKRGLMA